ncbi:hypothetical protein [Thiobacillus sp.]
MAAAFAAIVLAASFAAVDYWVVTSEGRIEKADSGEFGIPKKDAKFLANFAGEIISQVPNNANDLKRTVRNNIISGYQTHIQLFSGTHDFGSDRERLIVYAMLRVNGSLPIYKGTGFSVEEFLPRNWEGLVVGKYGNCGIAATRLLMVLDAFAIPARAVVWFSPSLTGHIFVDAYDPVERKAYLLDPSFNVWDVQPHVDEGYMEVLAGMKVEDRKRYLRGGLSQFPFYIVGTQGIHKDINAFREEQHLKIKDAILSALTYEMPVALENWKNNYPHYIPFTLGEAAVIGNNADLQKFNPSHPLATRALLEMAGLKNRDLRSDYLAMQSRLPKASP